MVIHPAEPRQWTHRQNGRVGCNEAKKNIVPSTKTAVELSRLALRATYGPQRLSAPAIAIARLRDPTDSAARLDTVNAVPKAIAKVARTPAQTRPWVAAKIMTSKAPVQGRTPIENEIARARAHESSPRSSPGPGR